VLSLRWSVIALAFLICPGFTADSAGRACVQSKGERGTGYDVDKTKVKDAYTPNGRRMLQDGQRVYEVEVPALIKRDKPILCTMTMANGMWTAPRAGAFDSTPFTPGNNPFNADQKVDPDALARERREQGVR
jgi:hypothetical protein